MATRYRHRHRRRMMSEINVVPYIDVMLVLLIIFMVTAPLLQQGVKVDLPQAGAKPIEDRDQETLIVTIDKQGSYFLDDRKIEPEELSKKVTAILRARPQTPVMIRGDRAVDYGQVVKAMALLQSSGAPSVGLITDPVPPKRNVGR